jgi:four helix bundle protein
LLPILLRAINEPELLISYGSNIALASLEECRYYIILSKDLKYTTNEDSQDLRSKIEEVSKLLYSYAKAMKQNNH